MQGLLNIYKPKDYTSFDCVAILRKKLGVKKIGHTGTLDPMAEGVLCCCIGSATRIISYLENDTKEYEATLLLGAATDTDDITGSVVKEADAKALSELNEAKVRKVIDGFVGDIEQIPPAYAAIKVDGKKLYEYAREGNPVEAAARRVHIYDIHVTDVSLYGPAGSSESADSPTLDTALPTVRFSVHCSKGTYIRSLCRDIGKALGVYGTMAALTRSRNGSFRAADGISIEDVKDMTAEEIMAHTVPAEEALSAYPAIKGTKEEGMALIQGKPIASQERFRGYDVKFARFFADGTFVGMVKPGDEDTIRADKILRTELP